MRYSKQNELIYNALVMSNEHLSADDLYQILKKDFKSMSLATVYRNLNKLTEMGSIVRLSIPNGADRYSANLDDHYHFLCTNCDKIFDIRIAKFENINQIIEEKTTHKVKSHNIIFKGICKNCRTDNVKIID